MLTGILRALYSIYPEGDRNIWLNDVPKIDEHDEQTDSWQTMHAYVYRKSLHQMEVNSYT